MCLKIATKRWINMHDGIKCPTNKIIRVQEHLDIKKPNSTPTKRLWMFISTVDVFADKARDTFVGMKGLTTFIFQKCYHIWGLINI